MADPREFRKAVEALSVLDAEVIRRVAKKRKVHLPGESDPSRLAESLIAGLFHVTHFFDHLTPQEQDAIGEFLGVGPKKDWRPKLSADKIASLPFHAKPSWKKDVFDALCQKSIPKRAAPRRPKRPAKSTGGWPKLTRKVTEELARALGEAFESRAPERIWHREAEVMLHAIPAGTFKMGLRPAERPLLETRAKRLGPEAVEHARQIVTQSLPVRTVKVEPFLISQTAVKRGTARNAAQEIHRFGARLPSEAEWEYLARGKGDKAWLTNRTSRWAVLELDWTDWVEDGWHPGYKDAPKDSSAWQPRTRPEVARGGLMALWPWQAGEEIQMLAAARIHDPDGVHGIRLAWSLPPR